MCSAGAIADVQCTAYGGAVYLYSILTNLPPLAIDCEGELVTISWAVTRGVSCAVDQSSTLFPAQWSLLPHGRGNPCAIRMDAAARFFRVRAVPALMILQGPSPRIVREGSSATLWVQATGVTPLTYQWWFNNTVIAGATGDSLAIVNAQPSHQGDYRVTVFDACGSVTGEPAMVYVLP